MTLPAPVRSATSQRLRVVSLLPSATEIVQLLGAGRWIVGRSHECDYPSGAWINEVPALTSAKTVFESSAQIDRDVRAALAGAGTGFSHGADGSSQNPDPALYTLDESLLRTLKPDVIITQDLCRVCSIDPGTVRRIAAELNPAPRIVSLNPTTLEGVFDDVLEVGRALGLEPESERALVELRSRVYSAGDYVNPYADGPNVAFVEWTDPVYIGGHWTPQLIERAGGRHPLNPTTPLRSAGAGAGPIGTTLRTAGASVRVPTDVLVASRPDRVIVCPCGLSLEQTRDEVEKLAGLPWWRDLTDRAEVRVALVDGNQMFNRPGPRLVDAFEWLVSWLNDRSGIAPAEFPWEPWPKS